MDSVDDSTVVTPAETSNLSTPDSSSSDVSQPTVKLRINEPKYRRLPPEPPKRRISDDNTGQSFLLDRDGCLLIETTGRTAQKARASIRDTAKPSQRSHQREEESGRKIVDTDWPRRCDQPRKSRSTTSVETQQRRVVNRRLRKRHSYGVDRSSRRSIERTEIGETTKRYSTGDYLRQQILEDLNSNDIIGKSDEQIAEDRCKRVKAYLRRRQTDQPYVGPEARLRQLKKCWKSEETRDNDLTIADRDERRRDLDRIRAYLQEKIRSKMNEENWQYRESKISSVDYPNEPTMQDIRKRYSDYCKKNSNESYPTRRVRSDACIEFDRLSSESGRDEKLVESVPVNDSKIKGDRGRRCRRTRSEVIPEAVIDPDDNEVRKRYYSYTAAKRSDSWKTKSGLTFEKKLSLPIKSSVNLERYSEASSPNGREDRYRFPNDTKDSDCRTDGVRNFRKYCRRTRSDTLPEKFIQPTSFTRRTKRRSVSWSDKRKLHGRTSERFAEDTSLDSDAEPSIVGRRAKNRQTNSLCSWREYKEKRRLERMRKEMACTEVDGASAKICTTPKAWTNIRRISAKRSNETPIILDSVNTAPVREDEGVDRQEIQSRVDESRDDKETIGMTRSTSTNENSRDSARNNGETADETETETILQENYLLLELNGNEPIADLPSTTISKLQVNEYRDGDNDSLPYELNAEDIGYDTIPKNRQGPDAQRCGWLDFNAKSNVKKSDTFKIVDGSEDTIDQRSSNKKIGMCNSNEFMTSRPSSDSKSSTFDRRSIIGNVDDPNDYVSDAGNLNDRYSEADDSRINVSSSNVATAYDVVSRSNKDIARDYFRRVYELLKQRQDDSRRETAVVLASTGHEIDTSSSNCDEHEEVRKRRRRRRRDKNYQGEELVTVSPGVVGDDDWTVQRLLVNNDTSNLIFRRPQLQNVTGHKRPRHPAPPIPANCKINAKDISKYFDYPNKENSPRNGVNENRRSERNESIDQQQQQQQAVEENENEMGSNLSRHNGKGLTGRRTQSSGNLCDPKGKLNHVSKILVPCSSSQRERYKICGSLPNHLDDKEILEDEDARENNNVISDTMVGNLGGTLPHKKRTLGVHFSDTGPTGTLDLVKHRSQDSLEGDPWRYQDGADLDLVRCKHGNFDLVRKNQSVDVVDGDASGKKYGTFGRTSNSSKCHRGADLDLVGALPKRRTDESKGAVLRQSFETRQNRAVDRHDGGDLLIKVMHKPDCELMKHRQFDRIVDLKLSRLAGGEPQDQGYASERSPEDEHPPSLPGQPFPNVTPESTFRVTLQKSSRGLGLSVSGGGTAGPVRVKRLFPQQPAALSNKLQPGDILLAANGVPLTGLTNYEALEVLRTTPSTVELVVCRLPGDTSITPPGAPPPPPARREPPPPLRILNPLPPLQIEPCGEFDIEMTKVAGSLGFTLRKVDSSALGHYVRALVREPALSDGRIQPGDKIVAVDGAPLSPMSHEEAVALLRQCGPRVKLRLYRDLAQTPVSALSPTEPDHPLRPPRTSLRQEAVDMLCDLAVRKLSPGTSNGSSSRQTSAASCHSPRRLRKPLSRTPTADNEHENHLTFHPVQQPATSQAEISDTDQCSINTQTTNSQIETPSNDIIDPPPLYDVCDSSDSSKIPSRPSFLDLTAPPEKPHFQFSLESDSEYTGPMIVTESDSNLTAECDYDDDLSKDANMLANDVHDNNLPTEPASMPPLLTTTRTTSGVFSYKNPAYQSANPTCGGIDNSAKNKAAHSSDQDIPGAEDPVGSKGLLKWKGVMFAPNDRVDETNGKTETDQAENESTTESATRHGTSEDGNEVFMVELTRGWNSRLGFSLQPEGNSTVISVVHPDSVAAKDGRLKQGDVLIMVNDESVENMPTAEIIDLLRKIRGSIGITVMRTNKRKHLS